MNQVTKKVLYMQSIESGSVEWDDLFSEVYSSMQDLIEGSVQAFSYGLKGDTHQGYSEAALLLIKAIKKFAYKGYEFRSFYSRALKNKLTDLTRSLSSDKMKHQYDLSLDHQLSDGEGGEFSVEDRFSGREMQVVDRYQAEEGPSVTSLLAMFEIEKPLEAGVIEVLIAYSGDGYSKSDLTAALAEYYGADRYDGKIQRRVSRARDAYKKFMQDHGFSLPVSV